MPSSGLSCGSVKVFAALGATEPLQPVPVLPEALTVDPAEMAGRGISY